SHVEKQLSGVHRSAVLLIQPHSWTSRQSQLPVLTIKTTYSKAAMLSLPAGFTLIDKANVSRGNLPTIVVLKSSKEYLRHVFCLHAHGTLGYHIHLCSKTQFILGDEETIMPYLTKESVRFTEQALAIFRTLSSVVACFSDEQKLPSLRETLEETHCPHSISSSTGRWKHQKVFNSAVYHMVCEALGRKLTSREHFALQALTGDPSLLASDPEISAPTSDTKPSEMWEDSEPTDKEIQAAIILQAGFRGHLVRGRLNALKPGKRVHNYIRNMQ
ncbi:hypothetical protein GOODEAATRI_027588, partial [Goodea atripinnis]